jgi:outer membrane lipoprotein carrier protein
MSSGAKTMSIKLMFRHCERSETVRRLKSWIAAAALRSPRNDGLQSIKYYLKRTIFILCLFSATNLYAEDSAEESLAALLNNYHTLQAQFTENTVTNKGEIVASTNGDIAFQRPDLFRWYTVSPSRQLIINRSQKLAIYDVDLEQVTYKNVDEQYGATPALLLSGNVAKLKQHYTIKACTNNAANCYQLEAKDDNDVFRRLIITFNNTILKSMVIENNLDQSTKIQFTAVKINSNLPSSLFKLNLPAGVDVVQ